MPDNKDSHEIEVTPEMIKAGVDELLSHPVYADARGDGPSMADWIAAVGAVLVAALRAAEAAP